MTEDGDLVSGAGFALDANRDLRREEIQGGALVSLAPRHEAHPKAVGLGGRPR